MFSSERFFGPATILLGLISFCGLSSSPAQAGDTGLRGGKPCDPPGQSTCQMPFAKAVDNPVPLGGGGGGGGSGLPALAASATAISTTHLFQSSTAVNTTAGNVFYQATDYETEGPNKLSFTRYYNSASGTWSNNYSQSLSLSNHDRTLIYTWAIRADGKSVYLYSDGNGGWQSPTDMDLKLTNSGSTWTLTDADDTIETYTQISQFQALLTSIKVRGGYTRTLGYNANNQLISVTDSYGRTLTFTPGPSGPTSLTTPDGLVVTYTYSLLGNIGIPLTKVTYSTNPQTSQQYAYCTTGGCATYSVPLLTGVTDENGNQFASWTYEDPAHTIGCPISSQYAGGAGLTTISYADSTLCGGPVTVTNALGQQEVSKTKLIQADPGQFTSVLTEIDRLTTATTAAATRLFTYDGNGYLASATDWGGDKTTYVNDVRGLPLTVTEAAGTPQQRVTNITWHGTFHLPLQIVAPGSTSTYAYDANGNLLTFTETDTTNNTIPYSTNGQTRTWTYTWSNTGLPISTTDPLGHTTQFGWDGTGALLSVTNPLGQVWSVTQHLPGGLPQVVADPNGVTTTLAYDARNRLVSTTTATAAGPRSLVYSYDPAGNLVKTTLPDGSYFIASYDAAHRLIGRANLLGEQIAFALDGLGDRTVANTLTAGNAVVGAHSGKFDALGRLLQDIGGVGQTTTLGYDPNGNLIAATDPLGGVTTQAFDALSRMIQITDAGGGVTTFGYDQQDNLVRVTDPNGNSTLAVYDGFGEAIGTRSPDTGDTVFYYDATGNLVKKQRLGLGDSTNVVTNYSYDALNRLTTITYPTNPAKNASYFYDEPGAGFGLGRLTRTVDNGGNAGTLKWTYDELGNVLTEVRSRGGVSLATAYAYDKASRLVAIGYPSGAAASYGRDAIGRVSSVALQPPGRSAQAVVSSIGYLPFGPVTGFTYGNGVAETRSFDLDYRLTGLSDAGNSVARNLAYAYDAEDNVLSIADNAFGNQSFGYDALDRLTAASGWYGNLHATYDPVGNLLTGSSPAVTENLNYASGSNRLSSISVGGNPIRQFSYTPLGNVASDQQGGKTIALGYDQDNRLAGVTVQPNGGQPSSYNYAYDGFGLRLAKILQGTPGALTVYDYSLGGALLEEIDLSTGTPKPQADYVYFGGRPVATLTPANGNVLFLHGDLLGTTQAATTAQQGVAWAGAYTPFGAVKPLVSNATQNLRFPGQYADAETGYYNNGFRDYDPSIGRYLESDPIGLAGGLDTYLYADGNPIAEADPSGLRGLGDAAKNAWKNAPKGLKKQVKQTIKDEIEKQLTKITGNPKFSKDTVGDFDKTHPAMGAIKVILHLKQDTLDPYADHLHDLTSRYQKLIDKWDRYQGSRAHSPVLRRAPVIHRSTPRRAQPQINKVPPVAHVVTSLPNPGIAPAVSPAGDENGDDGDNGGDCPSDNNDGNNPSDTHVPHAQTWNAPDTTGTSAGGTSATVQGQLMDPDGGFRAVALPPIPR